MLNQSPAFPIIVPMNMTDIIEKVAADTTGVPKKTVEAIIKSTFNEIASALARGEDRVSLSNFGSFTAKIVPPKQMKSSLHNGGIISVGKTSKVLFSPSDNMKEKIAKANKARVHKPTKK